MSNLILIFICLTLGLLFQRVRRFPANAADVLNVYVIYVALPALVLNEIAKLTLDYRAFLPVAVAWIVMAFGAALTFASARIFKWSRPVTGAMLLVVTLGNTGFVGIPLIDAHLGASAIPYAILYDQFGTFLALNTIGVACASYYSQGAAQSSAIWRSILGFPPFGALLFAFLLRFVGYPLWLSEVLPRLASTLVPVVMVAVGLQWRLRLQRDHILPLVVALVALLLLKPIVALFVVKAWAVSGTLAAVIVLEAAMPAMISAGVLATAYNLAPRLASSIVGYSLMLSLLTVWLWRQFI